MNRREFTQGLGVSMTLPLLPIKALAGHGISAEIYSQAANNAARWTFTSVGRLQHAFGLEAAPAKTLFDALIRSKVISGSNALGVARATTPHFANPALVGSVRQMASALQDHADKQSRALLKTKAEEFLDIDEVTDESS